MPYTVFPQFFPLQCTRKKRWTFFDVSKMSVGAIENKMCNMCQYILVFFPLLLCICQDLRREKGFLKIYMFIYMCATVSVCVCVCVCV